MANRVIKSTMKSHMAAKTEPDVQHQVWLALTEPSTPLPPRAHLEELAEKVARKLTESVEFVELVASSLSTRGSQESAASSVVPREPREPRVPRAPRITNPDGSTLRTLTCRCCHSTRGTVEWKERNMKDVGGICKPCAWAQSRMRATASERWSEPAMLLEVLRLRQDHRSRPAMSPRGFELLERGQ